MEGGRVNNNLLEQHKVSWDDVIIPSPSWDFDSLPELSVGEDGTGGTTVSVKATENGGSIGRKKRRRTMKSGKNKEEIENQRMTHIAVERNRRKQMNEYLSVIRLLMPASYAQRGDQASIIGGAINFVKELEQLVQSLEAKKNRSSTSSSSTPFADLFNFPQYSMHSSTVNRSALADIEVTMVETYANLKIVSNRRPKQLLKKMVVGLQNIRLTALHLNVTTIDQMVLYSLSLKVEDDCKLITVDEIANFVYQILERIEEECDWIDKLTE